MLLSKFFILSRYRFQDGARRRPTDATMPIARHLLVASEKIGGNEVESECGTILRILPRPRVAVRMAAVIAATCRAFMPGASTSAFAAVKVFTTFGIEPESDLEIEFDFTFELAFDFDFSSMYFK